MSTEIPNDESLWWMIKPAEPSRMARALQTLRLRKIPHKESERGQVLLSELYTVKDIDLRAALGRQVSSSSNRSLILPVANHDGTLSHVWSVPRGSMFDDRSSSHEDN